ncbi:MAG: hypothetical protein RHS_4459 [Robinsoniella sp. RHS]|nr:MAG: hypothetical protein RHS_4459 [Robinsoniella sp. RHS]
MAENNILAISWYWDRRVDSLLCWDGSLLITFIRDICAFPHKLLAPEEIVYASE